MRLRHDPQRPSRIRFRRAERALPRREAAARAVRFERELARLDATLRQLIFDPRPARAGGAHLDATLQAAPQALELAFDRLDLFERRAVEWRVALGHER